MADYQPLIAKAVAGLEKSTGEARRSLYERARTALVTQLRGVVPALSESDITRERLALEEAIRKVEAEAARKSRFDPPPERRRGDRARDRDQRRAGGGRRERPQMRELSREPPQGREPPRETAPPRERARDRTAREAPRAPAPPPDEMPQNESPRRDDWSMRGF